MLLAAVGLAVAAPVAASAAAWSTVASPNLDDSHELSKTRASAVGYRTPARFRTITLVDR